MNRNIILSTVAVCVMLAGCTGGDSRDDSDITAAVDSFAAAYFNYDFKTAAANTTPESVKWLRFAASNVIDEDIELLRTQEEGASHQTENIRHTSDTTARVRCSVSNFLLRDTLGRAGRIVKNGSCVMNVVLRNGRWTVDAGSLSISAQK